MHINTRFIPAGTVICKIFRRPRAYDARNPANETIRRQNPQNGGGQKSSRPLRMLLSIISAALLLPGAGCAVPKQELKKLQDVEYTIVEDRGIPEKLMETIEQKKAAEFKISFENDDGLYMVHGYGEQETGGYSIVIRDLYLTEHALYFDTELLGPKNGSNPQKKPSFPYIVVKTKKYKQNIVFE